MIRAIKIHGLKIYYKSVCVLTNLVKSNILIRHKIFLGTLLLSLTVISCNVKQNETSCHKATRKIDSVKEDSTQNKVK